MADAYAILAYHVLSRIPAGGDVPDELPAVDEALCAAAMHHASPANPSHGGASPVETTQALRRMIEPSAVRVFEGALPAPQAGNTLKDAREHAATQMATAFHEHPRRVLPKLARKTVRAAVDVLTM